LEQLGNVVEAEESRFKRHANVGRLLRAGWFFGLTERLTELQRQNLTADQQ
jgi:hypothetical protein